LLAAGCRRHEVAGGLRRGGREAGDDPERVLHLEAGVGDTGDVERPGRLEGDAVHVALSRPEVEVRGAGTTERRVDSTARQQPGHEGLLKARLGGEVGATD